MLFKKKFMFVLALVLILSVGLLGCGGGADEPADDPGEEPAEDPLSVAVVVEGTLGDRSFFDSANEGLNRAIDEYGIEGRVLECSSDPSAYFDQMLGAAENFDVVVAVGFQLEDAAKEISSEFPEVEFMIADMALSEDEHDGNLASLNYEEHEGSFLAGALAALMTETGSVGMVGGMDIPVINNFRAGYEQGIKYVDDEVDILVSYAGDFLDPAAGKENALELYNRGADIIFQVAGLTGEGVFEAAEETGNYAIGVDSDQGYINPDHIIASMLKEVGFSIYDSIGKILDGTFESGKVYNYGLEENGVGLCWSSNMDEHVPEDIQENLKELEEKIRAGEIEVEEGYGN